jgi:cobalt/nickel transport system permease protein
MHIPDGFLDLPTAIATAAIAATGLTAAFRRASRQLEPQRVPLVGLTAAFVFAAQMLNFPIAAGTSGHLMGAVLAMVLVGPAAAVVVMTAVLILQCLMFADGGVTALGANLLNMAIVAPVAGYAVFRAVGRLAGHGMRSLLLAAGLAAWCSTVAAALACAAELSMSGTASWGVVSAALVGVHMAIGLVEAVITMLIVAFVARVRPELLLTARSQHMTSPGLATTAGLLTSFGLLVVAAPLASSLPDGLESVAGRLGFAGRAALRQTASLATAQVHGFQLPSAVAGLALGLAGLLAAFMLSWSVARALAPDAKSTPDTQEGG